MANKITYVSALNDIIDGKLPTAEAIEKLTQLRDSLEKKAGADRKPTERQIENSDIARAIVRYMKATPDKLFSIGELWKNVPGIPEDMTNQRLTSIVRTLLPTYGKNNVGTGELVRVQDKRNVFFKINPDHVGA